MDSSGAGEGGPPPLLGSLRPPRSPEKGSGGGNALSFSWPGGRGGGATPGAGGGREGRREKGEKSERLIAAEGEDGKVLQGHLSPSVGLLMSA